MRRVIATCCAILVLTLAACATDNGRAPAPSSSAPSNVIISPTSDGKARSNLGRQVGGTSKNGVNVAPEGGSLSGSLMRGMAHVAAAKTPASQTARDTFTGTGASLADLLRVAKRPIDPKIDYVELLYGYLAAVDPGGTVESTAFYIDNEGCETDVLERRSKNGTLREYFVDTTGWQDQVAIELEQPINRTCMR